MADPTPEIFVEPVLTDSLATGMSYYGGLTRYTFDEATNDWTAVAVPDQVTPVLLDVETPEDS